MTFDAEILHKILLSWGHDEDITCSPTTWTCGRFIKLCDIGKNHDAIVGLELELKNFSGKVFVRTYQSMLIFFCLCIQLG